MAENQFDWVEFYSAFAHELLKYKDNRKELIKKVNEVNDFLKTLSVNKTTAKLELDGVIDDIDPFTIFGIFNKQRNDINRLKIIKRIKEIFNISANLPTSLHGIPTLNNQNATYYLFKDKREEDDINILWNLFESAIKYSNNKNENNYNELKKDFNLAFKLKGNKTSKITCGLFWIASDSFLNLDSTNRNYIYNSSIFPEKIIKELPDKEAIEDYISFDDYYKLLITISSYLKESSKDFRQFSANAWEYSRKVKGIKQNIVGNKDGISYWLYSPGNDAEDWEEQYNNGIIAIGKDAIGDLKVFKSKEEMRKKMQEIIAPQKNPTQSANTSWQFVHVMKPGDIVFAKKGRQTIIGRGIVSGDYKFDSNRIHHKNIRNIQWTHKKTCNFSEELFAMKTLTNITNDSELIKKIENSFNNCEDNEVKNDTLNPLNQILYGPPGTGKTYNTVIKAMEIIKGNSYDKIKEGYLKEYNKEKDGDFDFYCYKRIKEEFNDLKKAGQIEFITFHQSYAYEEFVEGIKPNLENWDKSSEKLSYKGSDGVFKKIAQEALYERLEITEEKTKEILKFKEIIDKFCEKYIPNGKLETKNKSEFTIVGSTKTSIKVIPKNGQNGDITYLTLKFFEEALRKEEKIDSVKEFGKISGVGRSSYYFPIYEELYKIKTQINKNNVPNNEKLDEDDHLSLIKQYYENKEGNKISLKKDINNSEKYVLIIDEINRGNISKIFGELITLLEEDKRESFSVRLPYSHEEFTVPKNLYIIGTMNTSDRSIASIDIALRRRFTFKEMMPDKNRVTEEIKENNTTIKLQNIFNTLNKRISVLLDRDHQIGHSYFMNVKCIDDLKKVWFNSIMPLLNEYFYNDWEKLRALLGEAKDPVENKDNNDKNKKIWPSFIKKTEETTFAIEYEIDKDEQFDFVSDTEIDFEKALENAFTKKTS